MEKKFALISLGVMCVVFIFIFANSAAMAPATVPVATVPTTAPVPEPTPEPTIEEEEVVSAVGDLPIVTITMEDGATIRLELYPEIAPNTVNNFIYLANQGFYDGLIFHRVIPGFMLQGGCPQGSGGGGPGYTIRGEFTANGFENNLSHTRGVISMARTPVHDSAGSQFFIMHQDSLFLDEEYASFGRVIEGIEIVDRIAGAETTGPPSDRPLSDQVIREIRVETFGVEFPEPEKL